MSLVLLSKEESWLFLELLKNVKLRVWVRDFLGFAYILSFLLLYLSLTFLSSIYLKVRLGSSGAFPTVVTLRAGETGLKTTREHLPSGIPRGHEHMAVDAGSHSGSGKGAPSTASGVSLLPGEKQGRSSAR